MERNWFLGGLKMKRCVAGNPTRQSPNPKRRADGKMSGTKKTFLSVQKNNNSNGKGENKRRTISKRKNKKWKGYPRMLATTLRQHQDQPSGNYSVFANVTEFLPSFIGLPRLIPYSLHFIRFNRVFPSFSRFYRVLPSFIGFYWVLFDFTTFYCVLLGFTGFQWIFTGFYWV